MLSPWIHTTDNCNIHCSYCHVEGNNTMSSDVYQAILKMIPKESHIRIGGGEPLLVYDNWKDWILNYNRVEVLTNFRIIPNDYFKLPSYVYTSVSIDGYGCKPLDSEIIQNVSKLKNPWIMSTIGNLDALPLLAYYISLHKYGWAISTDYYWNEDSSFDDLVLAMIEVIMILKYNNYDFRNFIFNNLDFTGRGGCCAGREMISIYCDGKIYPCQTMHNRMDPIGDVFKGSYNKVSKIINEKCNDCEIKNVCTGWCPLHHIPGNKICQLMKLITQEVIYAK